MLLAAVAFVQGVDPKAFADTKAERVVAARERVQEALHREIYGLEAERAQLLEEAARLDPTCAPAQWHRGYVRYLRSWVPVDDVPELSRGLRDLTAYERFRRGHPDSVAGHFALAEWCRDRGLVDQERAHLSRILDFDPDHALARARLGFRQVDGQWIGEGSLRQAEERDTAVRAALAEWLPKMEDLRDRLGMRSKKIREEAAKAIREIRRAAAIPAMEAILFSHSEAAALAAVDALGEMPEQEAVSALARQAVLSSWPAVRQSAARKLKRQDPDRYVPSLLAEMYTPVVSRVDVTPTRDGLAYRHSFVREGQDQRQVLIMDTRYRRVELPSGDGRETLLRTLLNTAAASTTREWSVDQLNAATNLLNERISRALNIALDQQLPPIPERWWQWWNEENNVAVQGQKQTRTVQRTAQLAVVDRIPGQNGLGGDSQSGNSALAQRFECFAAGTPVWTLGGLLAIEDLRVGDLVLGKDAESGELAYKPVLRTTVRPAEPLMRIQIGDEEFQTTEGHCFWISGRGWVRARELQSGMQVHSLRGAVPVVKVEKGGQTAETHNLRVADFQTYFVGEGCVLSHDLTERRPVRTVVPGLRER
jgi:hypothetical protein